MGSQIDQLRIQNLETRLSLRRSTCVNLALEFYAAVSTERRKKLDAQWEKSVKDMEALQLALERLKQANADEREAQFDVAQRL